MMPLPFRNALHDDDAVASVLRHEGTVPAAPLVTIAIPTFNRPELIRETLASALAQSRDIAFEIVIIDNASESDNVAALLDHLVGLGAVPVRYFVNDANIGMFGNWNRCITLARGEWLTILSDDDLLRPDHLARIFARIRPGDPPTVYTCAFSFLDQRAVKTRSQAVSDLLTLIRKTVRFRGRRVIDLKPQHMFWSNVAGSSLGAVIPRALATAIGGFYPEDFPSADYYFHVRAALRARVRQVSDDLALVRLQVNESMKPSTLLAFIVANHRLRLALVASGAVPSHWARYSPVLVAHERGSSRRIWGGVLSPEAVEEATGVRERRIPGALVWFWKAMHRGV